MKNGLCAYCGKESEITYDHIPPKSIFSKPFPKNLIKVPSCYNCNVGASRVDEYFRLIFSIRNSTFDHPTVQKNIPKIRRSLERRKFGGLRKLIVDSTKIVNLRTKSGLYIGKAGLVDPDSTRTDQVLRRIAKGLFYYENKRRLPDEYNIIWNEISNIKQFSINQQITIIKMLDYLQNIPLKVFGLDVFKYRFMYCKDDKNYFFGTFNFYLKVWFLVYSLRKEDKE